MIKNVKSRTDLAGLGVLIILRGSYFFKSLVDPKNTGSEYSILDFFKMIGK